MAYDWRDALRRKLPRDPAFGALPLLARLFFLSVLDEVDADGWLRVGEAAPADALAFMLGAHAGERRMIRGWFALYVGAGLLRVEGARVCLRPVAGETNPTNETSSTNRTNETNSTSSDVTPRNSTTDTSSPADVPAATNETNSTNPVVTPRNDTDGTSKVCAVAEAPGGSPSGLPSSLPHTPSLTPLPASPSDHAVPGGSASPGEPTSPAPSSETTRKPPRPDTDEPLPGTPAAGALDALRSTRLLLPIVVRPCELAETITAGAFPALDVPREIAAAEAWLVGNPANAKRNGARYLINWLKQAQERAPRVDPRQSGEFTRPGPRPAPEADPGAAIRDAAWAEWERKMRAAGKEIPR
jgi:hypothetical protein